MTLFSFSQNIKAMLLVLLPKAFQGVFAAVGDYYTWKLAEQVYGTGSNTAWTAVCGYPIIKLKAWYTDIEPNFGAS